MKIFAKLVLLFAVVCLALSLPGFAQYNDLYNNGPTNGTSNAWFIDVYVVSDSFQANGFTSGFTFAEWVAAGSTPLTVDWQVGTSSFGSDIGFGSAIFGQGGSSATLLCTNGSPYNGGTCGGGFGYDVYNSTVAINGGLYLNSGATYWLTVTNATDSFGGRDGWDINSGGSLAYHNLLGSVPSESFTINGASSSTCGCCGNSPSCIPEPSSILLFGSGIVGLLAVLRRGLSL